MSTEKNRFVTCQCLNCGGGIEFEGERLEVYENLTVDCPHCQKKTEISHSKQKLDSPPVIIPPPDMIQYHVKGGDNWICAMIGISGILFIGFGVISALNGLSNEFSESARYESSAIRQIVFILQYGIGIAMIIGGLILCALSKIAYLLPKNIVSNQTRR